MMPETPMMEIPPSMPRRGLKVLRAVSAKPAEVFLEHPAGPFVDGGRTGRIVEAGQRDDPHAFSAPYLESAGWFHLRPDLHPVGDVGVVAALFQREGISVAVGNVHIYGLSVGKHDWHLTGFLTVQQP